MSGFLSMDRLGRMIAVLLAVVSLAACGPRTLRTLLSPESYKTYVTLDLIASDGARERQTQAYRCNIIDVSDSLSPYIRLDQEGSPFWLQQADGSVMVVGDLHPCRWAEKPRRGLKGPLPPPPAARPGGNVFYGDTYVFDNGVAPTKIEVLATDQLFEASFPRVEAVTFSAKSQKSSERLSHAFPGLANLQMKTFPDFVSGLEPRIFSGVAAGAFRLVGVDCGGGTGNAPQILTIPHACLFPQDCTPERTTACKTYLGGVRVDFDARFDRGDLRLETLERLYAMTLYSGGRLGAASPPLKAPYGDRYPKIWAPRICYQDLCVEDFTGGAYIYDPKEKILFEISKFNRYFHTEFEMREYMFAVGEDAMTFHDERRSPKYRSPSL